MYIKIEYDKINIYIIKNDSRNPDIINYTTKSFTLIDLSLI